MDTQPILLDGTTLEGGGQSLRLALLLSSLLKIPIHCNRIRGRRGPKSDLGKDGGLKPAHLAACQWLAQATVSHTEGMELKSTDLLFRPSDQPPVGVKSVFNPAWKDIYEDNRISQREVRISISTPGSIALVLQAIIPYLLFGGSPVSLQVTIEGGTNMSNSPSIDYVAQVFLPLLSLRLGGIAPIATTIHRRGWSSECGDMGVVTFDVIPSPQSFKLPAFEISSQGAVTKVHMSIITPNEQTCERMKIEVSKHLGRVLPDIP